MANEIISTDVVPVNTNNQVVTGDTFDYEKKMMYIRNDFYIGQFQF